MKSSRRSITSLLLRRLQNLTSFKPTTILQPRRTFCAKSPANANNGNVPETSVSSYHEQYKQLEKLDFMTATKMLFTALPSKIKFGLDFHLVQLFFCCLPSLAVCLVAQYALFSLLDKAKDWLYKLAPGIMGEYETGIFGEVFPNFSSHSSIQKD